MSPGRALTHGVRELWHWSMFDTVKDERGRYRKTVVEAKCLRRQFVMAYLLAGMLSALSWLPAYLQDFAVLKERAEDPATIGVQISN